MYGRKKLTWGGQVSAEVLADNRYDYSKSPVHPTGHCHGRDRYASFRDRYAKPQTAPSDQARPNNQRGQSTGSAPNLCGVLTSAPLNQ